jgi:uncharacterized protein (DUF433 family)
MNERIESNPTICHGQPCIKGEVVKFLVEIG